MHAVNPKLARPERSEERTESSISDDVALLLLRRPDAFECVGAFSAWQSLPPMERLVSNVRKKTTKVSLHLQVRHFSMRTFLIRRIKSDVII